MRLPTQWRIALHTSSWPHWPSELRAARSTAKIALKARCASSSKHRLRASRYGAAASVAISGDGREARSAGQQSVEVEYAGCGEKDRHGTQHDGQDQIEQKDSERNEEAELEGCACANPDFLRWCDAVRVGHVLTLPSGPPRERRASPTGRSFGDYLPDSVAVEMLRDTRPCGSVPIGPNDHDLCEGWRSRALWWARCWPEGSGR